MRPDLSLRGALILLWTGAVIVIAALSVATFSQAAGPPVASAAATLNIVAGDVKVISPEGGPARAAKDGMNLAVGAHVVTGQKSTALVTFLDGSTLTVQPNSDATVKQADLVLVIGSPKSSNSVRLVEVAKRAGAADAKLVGSAADVNWDWFENVRAVGVTAGASAPEDLVEALVGAIYLDRGLDATRAVAARLFRDSLAALPEASELKDPKTRLQEWLQGRGLALPAYTVLEVSGEPHDQRFRVRCDIVELAVAAEANGSSRRRAEQEAAERVLNDPALRGGR